MPATSRELDLNRLRQVFLENVYSIPGGEKIDLCIQCGTCSGSCPTSAAMDYTPREIIAAFRAGMLDRVLRSNTLWLCASCYSCAARCPSGIKLTDVMYELKRLAIAYGLYAPNATAPNLSKEFIAVINKYGRNAETELMTRYHLKSSPLGLVGLAPFGLRMLARGRLPITPDSISPQGRQQIRKMLDTCQDGGGQR